MSGRRRLSTGFVGAAVALALALAACTSETITIGPPATTTPPRESPQPIPTGKGTAADALAKLCDVPSTAADAGAIPEGPTPPAIGEIENEVEQVRGLRFTEPVAVEGVSQGELTDRLTHILEESFPTELYERRSRVWQTIGAIPQGTSIRQSLFDFVSGGVIGFYLPGQDRLLFIGSDDPSPVERVTLAHELTHAIDDQHFELQRADKLSTTCQDDAATAASGAIEGSAQFFSFEVARRFLSVDEQLSLLDQQAPDLSSVPPFIFREQLWPYTSGLAFITALDQRGGLAEVNRAIQNLPVSTEQVMHPERYPNDVPTPVDVPNLGPALGEGWTDLDVQLVGEEWLSILLGLRLDASQADPAAAGWDGGISRAWSNGGRVAVLLSTVWDTPGDASEFADSMNRWLDSGQSHGVVLPVDGSRVDVAFGSDTETLAALVAAA